MTTGIACPEANGGRKPGQLETGRAIDISLCDARQGRKLSVLRESREDGEPPPPNILSLQQYGGCFGEIWLVSRDQRAKEDERLSRENACLSIKKRGRVVSGKPLIDNDENRLLRKLSSKKRGGT